MTAPTEVAPDQARHDYIARVYKMSHAELFAELMRVHTEANRLVEQAVKDAVQNEKDRLVGIFKDLHAKANGKHNHYLHAATIIEENE